MHLRIRTVVLALAVPASLLGQTTAPAPARPIDWPAMQAEAVEVLRQYVRINTTNPPGNELATAHFLKAFLEKEGIEATILDTAELGAGRANLYARLKGNGSKRAIALVQHMDVVPVSPAYWSVPAFSGDVKDGFIYGRGTLDMKGEGVAHLMALVALKRSGVPLTRDIVFVANADEELGSTGGIVFVDKHADLLKDVEYLFTEGGANVYRNGKLEYYSVGVAEKRTFWQRVTVKGTPSHGSRPTRENPVPRLVAALDRIARYETPLHVTPGVEKFFHDISRNYAGEQARWLFDVKTALNDRRAREWILRDVYWNAILRNTIS
ncbi:MAG: M20/M25/M40 family metallo-hydrolase, partial [Gemmatimonadaceae bacterium]